METLIEPHAADREPTSGVRFSICTLVTDHSEYAEMVRSFRQGGFDGPDCEYLYLDNSAGNASDAFSGGNIFLQKAAGDFVIMCHQDVVLLKDDRNTLETRMAELDRLDTCWALCGNAGGTASGKRVIRISDPHGNDQAWGVFPTQATALDENFIVIRRRANLALSRDLSGFHLYGADLCIIADVMGWTAWVIDFHLRHKSGGRADRSFADAQKALEAKYRRALRNRSITTTCTTFALGGCGPLRDWVRLFRRKD